MLATNANAEREAVACRRALCDNSRSLQCEALSCLQRAQASTRVAQKELDKSV